MGLNQEKKVWIIGHKNPDTDSICAAIAYAELKNQTSGICHEAKRAGNLNEETKYVLNFFHIEEPELATDVRAQIKDISFRQTAGVSEHISLKLAWELMNMENVVTLPVIGAENQLRGLIVTRDIATSYMDVYDTRILATAKTPYKNIAEALKGSILAGNEHAHFTKGRVVVETSSPDKMDDYIEDDDLVILGGHSESQISAIEHNASCLVVCSGFAVSKEVIQLANKRDCMIIGTPYDMFTVARLINQSMPIKHFMTKNNLIRFDLEDYVDDVREVMSKVRHRDFPIVDEEGNYVGMISRRYLFNTQKKQIILVDHNEETQAVDGINGAEILEIIDHHRLGSLETMSPVFFRNQPLGCTSTIIYQIYHDFNRKTPEEIFSQDFKTFTANQYEFGVAQLSAMSKEELETVQEKLKDYIDTVLKERKLDLVFVMVTDILEESTILMSAGEDAEGIISRAFSAKREEHGFLLKGVVSRKKQLIPALIAAMQE